MGSTGATESKSERGSEWEIVGERGGGWSLPETTSGNSERRATSETPEEGLTGASAIPGSAKPGAILTGVDKEAWAEPGEDIADVGGGDEAAS